MFPLILTVLNREYSTPPPPPATIIPTKDCSYKREHPKVRVQRLADAKYKGFRCRRA